MLAAVGTPRKRSRQGEAEGTKQPSSSRRGAKRSRQSNGHEVLDDDDDVANELLDLDHGDDDRDAEISQPALVRLDKAKLTIGLDRKRQEVLNRLSGHVTTTDDLVCLQEQAVTLEQTLKATVQRGESNSILLVGPRGSGKDAILKTSLASLGSPSSYHHVQISARRCTTDRAAMRELAQQLIQLGALSIGQDDKLDLEEEDDEEHEGEDRDGRQSDINNVDEADDEEKAALGTAVLSSLSNTTSSILSMLASASSSATSSSARPLIITLDSFDLLTTRPRQALLYCLLDAVQSGSYRPGLAIVGMTRRPDTTDLLEKRVKSRFSHRIVQCYPPSALDEWKQLVGKALSAGEGQDAQLDEAWGKDVQTLLASDTFTETLQAMIDVSKDAQLLFQSLYPSIASLSPTFPTLSPRRFVSSQVLYNGAIDDQDVLHRLPTMPFMLLIAAKHLELRADRSVFNFEMLLSEVTTFSRRSRREREAAGTGGLGLKAGEVVEPTTPRGHARRQAAKEVASGAGTGAHNARDDRQRAMLAFEELLSLELFLPDAFLSTISFGPTAAATGPPPLPKSTLVPAASRATVVRREYLRVRSVLDPHIVSEVAKARGKKGTLNTDIVQWAVGRTVA